MIFIPLPFVISIFLFILLIMAIRRNEPEASNKPFLALIFISIILSILSGLRWGYGFHQIGIFAPILASMLPPLAFLGISNLIRSSSGKWQVNFALLIAPPLIVFILMLTFVDILDIILVLIYIVYAVAILRLISKGADSLRLTPFEGAQPIFRAAVFTAIILLISACVDLYIFFDFALYEGQHTPTVIGLSNLVSLITLAIAAATISDARVPKEIKEPLSADDLIEDKETIAKINNLMETQHLYRDTNLNLNRLARKALITTRQISRAINRVLEKNVSQYVNEFRINEACNLLSKTEKPITEIMFDVGFLTKSNFNREFLRVTDTTPINWRKEKQLPSSKS